MNVVPLPGKALVILDPSLRLVIDVIPSEDGHAQARSPFSELKEIIGRPDVFIANRNFRTKDSLFAFLSKNVHSPTANTDPFTVT